jgi:CheY-like chemotaxis protein
MGMDNRKSVLLVDDERNFLATLADYLGSRGDLRVLVADNGRKALEVMASARVDLVVTDLKMPVMDGFELISRMKETCPDMPVIIMTAFSDPGVERRLASMGVSQSQCIEKPLDVQALEGTILACWPGMK